MEIREYKTSDCNEIADLFYNTVHYINSKDYTEEQLNVWATGNVDIDEWNKSFLNNYTVVMEENGMIVGFGDINDRGYLDRLYVHKDYQNIGIATALCDILEKKYDVEVQVMDVSNMTEKDVEKLFKHVLKEFPVKEINIDMPTWVESLDPDHWLKKEFFKIIKGMCDSVDKIRDIKPAFYDAKQNENLSASDLKQIKLGEGTANILLKPSETIFYKVLSENCDVDIESESDLIALVKDLNIAKREYDKIKDALVDVRETGYGLVAPQLSEMKFEEPEIVKQGTKFGVKLKASAPSLHFIKADIKTEISPIMGSEKESEELVTALMEQYEKDPASLWQSNMFGKSLEVLVKEGLQNKLYKMPEDVQVKIQKTLQKIINEGNGGLICIIL